MSGSSGLEVSLCLCDMAASLWGTPEEEVQVPGFTVAGPFGRCPEAG